MCGRRHAAGAVVQVAQGPQGRVTPSTTCGSGARLRAHLCRAVGGGQMVLPWGPVCWYRPREPCAEKTQTASAQVTRMQTASHKCPGYGRA